MNREEIMKILPHRDNMLLVDSAELVDGVAHGEKRINGDEWFLKGHFPGNPIVPGVILCEILAQSACVLLAADIEGEVSTFLTGLDKVRFKNPVTVGDTIKTECTIVKSKAPFYWATGKGFVNGKLCVSAEFSFAVTAK
jgi:3-hydroxymyristoyl/3-hydroxydecanoyl-(acyl carrier protein) dehydratases